MKNAQIALEYLVIAGFLLLATGVIFVYSIINLDQNFRLVKADTALSKLSSAAETVSSRGPGNALYVDISLPNEIQSNQLNIIAPNNISLTISTPSGPNERYETTSANLTPATITVTEGFNTIKVEMVDENVEFTEPT